MFCNRKWNQWFGWAMLALGIVSFAYGLLTFVMMQPEGRAANTLLGMFTGFGAGIIAVAVVYTIRNRRMSAEELEQQEIERNDERNVAIYRAASAVGLVVAMAVFLVLAFVLMGMDYRVPSFLCIGGLYVTLISMLIARRILQRKM